MRPTKKKNFFFLSFWCNSDHSSKMYWGNSDHSSNFSWRELAKPLALFELVFMSWVWHKKCSSHFTLSVHVKWEKNYLIWPMTIENKKTPKNNIFFNSLFPSSNWYCIFIRHPTKKKFDFSDTKMSPLQSYEKIKIIWSILGKLNGY